LAELIETFRNEPGEDVRRYVLMALDIARVPASVPFLAEVLREADPRLVPYAERALRTLDTPEARTAVWKAKRLKDATTE
jgi:hypothetical protein